MDEAKQMEALSKMQAPFKSHEISLLPKQLSKDDKDKGKCTKGSKYCADDKPCGGYHARAIHLDYVGHAALTKRLLEVDPMWSWEPVAMGPNGLPAFDNIGGLWIRLNVAGMSRLGYGDSQGKTGPNAVKEAIGDALRNAAMRFGAALDLWHKGDLYDAEELRGLTGEVDELAEAINRHADSIKAIKDGIASGNISAAVEAWSELTADEQRSIWVAPSNGGPFTTAERQFMKSEEWATVRKAQNAA